MAQFVDQALIELRAGSGGDGASHFRREKYAPRGGPDGGDGGRGGNLLLRVDPHLRTLLEYQFRHRFVAADGQPGGTNDRTGAGGDDIVLAVPLGTLAYDNATGRLLADLSEPGQEWLACRGGRGGMGNARFVSATHQAPTLRERGEPGEAVTLRLELKLLADAALVGYPNVGKSTLIGRLSAARPKIANYPFTTLTPNLGVVRLDHETSYVVADLPGLVEGAAEGRGLGHQFLRHLERARVVVHLLDVGGLERDDPVADYDAIRAELTRYDPHLARLPELVVANKLDLPDGEAMLELITEPLAERGVERILPVSAATGAGLDALRLALGELVFSADVPSAVAARAERELLVAEPTHAAPFAIEQDDEGTYCVTGREVERAVAMCDLDNDEAVMRLHHQLMRFGLIDALRRAGCGQGDAVRIGDVVLDFEE